MQLKRLVAGAIATILAVGILPMSAFANLELSDSEQAIAGINPDTITNSWRVRTAEYGYKVQMVFNREGPIEVGSTRFNGGNVPITNIISVSSAVDVDNIYVSALNSMSIHASMLGNYQYGSTIELFDGYDAETATISPSSPVSLGHLKTIKALTQKTTSPMITGQYVLDTEHAIANELGSGWYGIGDSLATKFAMDTRDSLTAKVFVTLAQATMPAGSTSGDPLYDLATQVYSRLEDNVKKLVGKDPGPKANDAKKTEFIDKVLPISPNCVVGWGVVVEPLYRVSINDGTPSRLPKEFNSFLGSSAEWNMLMGATAGFAQSQKLKYENMPDDTMQADAAKDEFYDNWHSVIDSSNQQKWGEFASAHSAMEEIFPMSVYTTQGWFDIPADPVPGGFHEPWQGTWGGSGIGVYVNVPVIPEVKPCCYPADPTDDPCPCGGASPCDCPEGCTCDPDNYTPGCDCVVPTPPVVNVPDPTIEEDHLSQQLNVPNLVSDNCGTDAWYVTFRPEYEGGEFRSDSQVKKDSHWDPDAGDEYHPDGHSNCIGLENGCNERRHYGAEVTDYSVEDTFTQYKWVLDSFNYDLKIPLNRFTVYSYLKPTQSLDLLKTVSGSPMFRLDGSYKNAHTFTYNKGDTTASVGNIFCDPQDVTWVSHRDELGVESWFNIGLSKYMSIYGTQTSTQNTLYKNIMNTNNVPTRVLNPGETVNAGGSNQVLETNDGSQLRDAFDKTQGNFQFDFQIKGGDDSLKTPGTTKYDWEKTGTRGPEMTEGVSSSELSPHETQSAPNPSTQNYNPWNSVVLNPSNFSQNVNVQGSYAGGKWGYTSGAQGPSVTVSGNGNTWTFITPSDEFHFYPSYKMKAATNANGGEQDVWCLGHIERSFQGYNKLTIQVNSNANDLDAVWSRDYGDSNTAKAGTAYQFTGGGGTIDITGHYLLMDPDFAADPEEQRATNASIIAGYESQIQAIVDSITPNNVSIYSNLYWAGDSPNYQPKIASNFAGSISGRENIKTLSKSASGSMGGSTKTFLPGHDGVQTRSHYGATAGDPLGLNETLKRNLERGTGVVKTWYNEDFEGIITVTVKATVNVGQVTTDLALIEENLSDSRTAANALAQPITVKTSTGQSFTKASGQYAIGVDLSLGNVSWGAASANVVCMFDPITFNVRGNAYDMAD